MADIPMRATAGAVTGLRSAKRLLFIDNIRWSMIILVLSMHASDTYSPFGNWYFTDRQAMGLGAKLFFGVYQSFLQAFFMAVLFFIAGYFSAAAYDRKGFSLFVRDRFIRLGLPTLLYMLVIGPLTQYFLSRTWGTRRFSTPMAASSRGRGVAVGNRADVVLRGPFAVLGHLRVDPPAGMERDPGSNSATKVATACR